MGLEPNLKRARRFKDRVNGELAEYHQVPFARSAGLRLEPNNGLYRSVAVALGYCWDPSKPEASSPNLLVALSVRSDRSRGSRLLIIHEPTETAKQIVDSEESVTNYLNNLIVSLTVNSPENFRREIQLGNLVNSLFPSALILKNMANKPLMAEVLADIYKILQTGWTSKYKNGQFQLDPKFSGDRIIINTLINFYILCTGETNFNFADFQALLTQKSLKIGAHDSQDGDLQKIYRVTIGACDVLLFPSGAVAELVIEDESSPR